MRKAVSRKYVIIEPTISEDIKPEASPEDLEEIKSHLEIVQQPETSFIIVLAINKDSSNNHIAKIPCNRGMPLDGYSYIYDNSRDIYFAECADYLMLGDVNVSFKMKFSEGLDLWNVDVPMPESLIKKYLTTSQNRDLKKFKAIFNNDYKFNFLQLTSFC